MEEAAKRSHPPHIALLADPPTGHLIPLSALAKHLHQSFNFSITLITQPISSQSQQKILNTLPKEIQVQSLPQIPIQSIPRNIKPHHFNLLTITHKYIPCLCEMLKSMKPNVTALVVDMFSMIAFDAVKELGIEIYSFYTSNCLSLALVYHIVRVGDERVDGESVRMPGCVAIEERDLPEPFGADRQSEEYKESLKFWKLYHLPKAILVNSFEELEPGPINLLKSDKSLPPIYAVGPLIQSGMSAGDSDDDGRCLKWLDKQPKGSVVYVSFGSGGTLSRQQTNELAYGLEMSGQRFIWAVKSPNGSEVSAVHFGATNADLDPLQFLPSGFIERTKGVGLLIPTWAPQIQILSHWATGGFVTHCGWNSTLESIMNEIPMIVWPLYAEQNMNAVMLVEDLKVAVRVEMDGNGVVGKEQISTLVRNVVEGEEGERFRNRMREIKEAAKGVLEEGGSSYKSCYEIASQWSNLQP